MKKLKPIMFVGTGSDVGKSIINTAFCRILKQEGYKPAPFKAQNMSLNSYATKDGLEIGRAQAVQAEACDIDSMVEMNPVLLKPVSCTSAQIVLNGKPWGNKSAHEYFVDTDRDFLFDEAMKSFLKLDKSFNPIVIEGAGSISELNLRDKDITNMRVAIEADASVYLVADIDRGGVFGSVYGTLQLLKPEEKKLINGIILNKFRGDIKLFVDGKKIMEDTTGIPVVGIIPYYTDIYIDDEDSVVLSTKNSYRGNGDKVNIAVVLLKHMSNFTDFNLLEQIPEVHLFYSTDPDEIKNTDIIIIPGSKNTISDLCHLRKTGMAKAILQAFSAGKAVYGICAGYQMMGEEIHDPFTVEGEIKSIPGLGILPVKTILNEEKKTKQCNFTFLGEKEICAGYEIHMGQTTSSVHSPLCVIESDNPDGFCLNLKTWGTYIHGIFDNKIVIDSILKNNGSKTTLFDFNIKEFRNEQYNKLADLIRNNSDIKYILNTLKVI